MPPRTRDTAPPSDAEPRPVADVHTARVTDNRFARFAWISGGTFSLGMGIVGVFVPGWPTTIFLIVAAACYARSSQRMYDRVIGVKVFGKHVKNFRETGVMPVRAKVMALGIMWPFVLFSIFVAIPHSAHWVQAIVLALALTGTGYILWLPGHPARRPAFADSLVDR